MDLATAAAAPEPASSLAAQTLSRRDFERLASFIHGYCGIKMPPSKRTMLEGRLRRRLKATGAATFAEYCERLFDGGDLGAETVHLIDAVTTNKTEFFREPEHFRVLAETVLPAWVAAGRGRPRAPLKVWSAGCSIGAEAYTIAMVCAAYEGEGGPVDARIVGTDICTEVLQAAVLGIYPDSMLGPVPAALKRRFVRRAKDKGAGVSRISPDLRSRAAFGRLNLMDASYPTDRDFDVVFCRNTLIYFDKPTQKAVLGRLCAHLKPGGHLFLGHSETLAGFDLPLRVVGPTTFVRT
ncbi:MAG TPA: CheR family methyltransferase [Caulobacteraceae bacterium]|nr:CheR family methyltransferase [Caulobacteraceae bacterium]